MSTTLVSAGLFAGGVVVGATGAFLVGRNAPVRAPPPSSLPSSSSPSVQQHSRNDARLIGGDPGPLADFLRNGAYVCAYDRARKHPHWTAEHITAASIRAPENAPRGDRSRSVFKEDERVPALFRATNGDYFRSGYDRGHMVPAADAKSSQEAMDETFYLSNIAPQVGEGFNRDYWAHTEDFCRRLTNVFSDVYIFTVPLYLPRQSDADGKWRITHEVIGNPPNVHVPTHFAKVIYGTGFMPSSSSSSSSSSAALSGTTATAAAPIVSRVGLSARGATAIGAFVMPNAMIPNQAPLQSFVVPVDAVERAAGLLLFPPSIKANARQLCDTIDCQIFVRDFSDRNRQNKLKQPASLSA